MKGWTCWITAALIGSLAGGLGYAAHVVALTEQQVIDRLQTVPVFAITDAEGKPLVATSPVGATGSLARVFIGWQDAQLFSDNLGAQDLAMNVQVAPVSLAQVYQLANNERERIEFAFVPMQQQIAVARLLLQQGGQGVEQFQGVPLFVARSSNEDEGYLTVQQDQQEFIPIFFKWEEMQQLLDRLRQADPNLASRMTVQVISLENLVELLETSDSPELNKIILVPPQESIEFIRSQLPLQSGDEAQATQELLQTLEGAVELLKKPFGDGAKL